MEKIKLTTKEKYSLVKAASIITVIKSNPETERWQGSYEELEEIENLLYDLIHGERVPEDHPEDEELDAFPVSSTEVFEKEEV